MQDYTRVVLSYKVSIEKKLFLVIIESDKSFHEEKT